MMIISQLKSDEFLDVDLIIEDALHDIIVQPLKFSIYKLFVDEYTK